jgi:hypothetical protein
VADFLGMCGNERGWTGWTGLRCGLGTRRGLPGGSGPTRCTGLPGAPRRSRWARRRPRSSHTRCSDTDRSDKVHLCVTSGLPNPGKNHCTHGARLGSRFRWNGEVSR